MSKFYNVSEKLSIDLSEVIYIFINEDRSEYQVVFKNKEIIEIEADNDIVGVNDEFESLKKALIEYNK